MTKQENIPKVTLYSDWWASPNPGKWWYGVILSCKWVEKEFSAGYEMTTNNRMELTGVITGLEKLKIHSKVQVYTDSQYTINGIEKWWAVKWKKNNWYRTSTEKATNSDLWEKLLLLLEKHEVTFHWVKWHNGHKENERCDELATEAMKHKELHIDSGFNPKEISIQTPLYNEAIIKEKTIGNSNSKWKVSKEWDFCKKCFTPVVIKKPKHSKKTLEKSYYYEYFFTCPSCKTNYMPEEAKRDIITLKI